MKGSHKTQTCMPLKPVTIRDCGGVVQFYAVNWHIHHAKSGGGQILVCVAGRGYYQEEGKEAVEMKPGDCINIPAEVKHWHGAAPDEWFSHLAIEVPGENGSNERLEPVSDEEYGKL